MLANPILAPQTAAANKVPIPGTETDKILICTNGAGLATTETVLLWVATSTNTYAPVYDATGAQASLKATLQSILLEGGLTYFADKSVTAGACGIDIITKPRQGAQ